MYVDALYFELRSLCTPTPSFKPQTLNRQPQNRSCVEYRQNIEETRNVSERSVFVKGYLAHKKHSPPEEHHRALGIGLL